MLVLERREMLGGACVTEELWPGARVSRASYVVSMLQPKIVRDLRLKDFGYRAVPLDPAYAAMTPDGPIVFFDDPAQTAASIARSLAARRRGCTPPSRTCLFRVAEFLAPDAAARTARPRLEEPARPARRSLREGARAAGLSQRDVHELVRIFTMSVGDLLDD